MTSLNRYLIYFDFLPRFQKKWIVVFFLPLILLGSEFVHAQTQQPPLLELNDTKGEYPLGLYMEILEDPSGELGIKEVSSAAYQGSFIANDQAVLDRGFTDSALWAHFKIGNSATNTNWQLVLNDARMGLIDVYLAGADGKGFAHQQSGRLVSFNDRHSPYYKYVFDIPIQKDQVQEVYIRLKTDTAFYAPLSIWSAGAFSNHYQSQIILLSLFYGAMLVMLMYNLVLFFMLKDVNYLYLSLYILFYGLYLTVADGLAPQYLWPAFPTQISIPIQIICGSFIFACLFTLSFLQIPRYSRRLAQFIKSIIAASLVLLVMSPFLSQASIGANLLAITLSITMGFSGIFVFSKGYQPARFYIIAWAASIVTLLIYALSNLGVLNHNWISEKGIHFSSLLLVVLWSLALADRISLLQSESFQANQKVQISENRISRFLNALPFGIMVHSKDTRLAYINRFAQNNIGFYPADGDYSITNPKLEDVVSNLQLFETGSGKAIKVSDLPLQTVFNGERVTADNIEVEIRGRRMPLEINSMPVFDENKQVEYAITFFQDISERRKQEAEIVASHQLLNGILENAADAIISVDEKQNITLFNKQAETVFGYKAQEVFQRPIEFLLPEPFRMPHLENIKMAEQTSQPITMMGKRGEVIGLRKNGEKFPARASVSRFHRESGNLYTVFLHDITEEKKQAEKLWESQSRYLNLYEHSPTGIVLANFEGKIIEANHAFQELIGYSEAELKEMTYFDITYPDDLEISRIRRDELLIDPGKGNTLEKRFVRKDGQVIWTTRIASVISDAQGNILNTYAFVNDISDRKFNEIQLLEYHERLEELVANRTMELHQSRERLAILNQASRVVNTSSMDLEQIYIAIHTATSWLTPTDVFSIILVNEAHGKFEEVYLATPEGRQTGARRTLENSFVERMLEQGTSLHMLEFPGESDRNEYDLWPRATEEIKSGLAVLLRGSKGTFGLLITQRIEPNVYSHIEQEILESFAAHAAIAIENSYLYRQAQENAAVEERRRLARELHDSVAQLLYSMILMNSGWEKLARQNRLSSPAEAFKQLGTINLQALKELRLLIHHLRPSYLEEMGLVNALRQRLETVEQRAGIKAQLEVEGEELPPLPLSIEDELYAIAQEALNNSLRHASASKVTVEIVLVEDELILSVQDNGIGFEVQNVKQGIGLSSMNERARKIDGDIEITSQPGQGTLVKVKVEI